ncbi:MAG TPA: TetR/AcrR family transcriptional regulator [Solirubrobacteraceae bacterium]|jgi:AcrR family transcriptional regulator|nr:TetR/AcrR family transcriptional regulator [Solirubrobacteraceae bacterium]
MADPRRERTRSRLIAAGRRLIGEDGVAALRIADITQEAGVAIGSFQNHFSSKEELVEAVVSDSLGALAEEIVVDEPTSGDAAIVAIAALRRFVRLAYDDPELARVLVNLGRGEELFLDATLPYARTALERAVREGAFAIEDVEIAATAIVAGGLAVIRRIVEGDLGADADVPLARMVLRGFGVEPGEAARIAELDLPPPSRAAVQVQA